MGERNRSRCPLWYHRTKRQRTRHATLTVIRAETSLNWLRGPMKNSARKWGLDWPERPIRSRPKRCIEAAATFSDVTKTTVLDKATPCWRVGPTSPESTVQRGRSSCACDFDCSVLPDGQSCPWPSSWHSCSPNSVASCQPRSQIDARIHHF